MTHPPPGYDDESVVPQKRLGLLLKHFENELLKIQHVFHQHVPDHFYAPEVIEKDLVELKQSADELGSDYLFLIMRLIADYEHFRDTPDLEKLEQLFRDVSSLQLLLTG